MHHRLHGLKMSENPNNPFAPKEEDAPSPEHTISAVFNPNPAVKTYQRIYVILMFLLYATILAAMLIAALYQDSISQQFEVGPGELIITLFLYGLFSAALAMVFIVGLFWHRGVGGLIYNIILICIGLTS